MITSMDNKFLIDYWTRLFLASLFSLHTDLQVQTSTTSLQW